MQEKDLLKELVLYVISQCGSPEKLGKTKLNKVLWFADSIAYQHTGQPITGAKYQKLQHGPVPIGIDDAIGELQSENKCLIREKRHYGYNQHQFIGLSEPRAELFSSEQLKLVDALVGDICENHTANSISDLSHDIAWEAAQMGEEIPLFATLAAREGVITELDIEWADSIIENLQPA